MPDSHRLKIANSNILSKLIAFAEGATINGEKVEMEPHRVTAALGLLKKVLPDISEATLKGDADAPLQITQIALVAPNDDSEA